MAVAAAVIAVVLWLKAGDIASTGSALTLLRFVAIILASSVCFVLDDDAADVLASSPATLRSRRLMRLYAGAALVVPPWLAALGSVSRAHGVDVPVLALTLEVAALVLVGLAAAAALERCTALPDPGVAASAVVFGLALVAFHLPPQWALFVPPEPGWGQAHLRLAGLVVAAMLLLAWCTRDPAAPSPSVSAAARRGRQARAR